MVKIALRICHAARPPHRCSRPTNVRPWPRRDTRVRSDDERRSSDDFKLFATTFLAGFVFVSILIA